MYEDMNLNIKAVEKLILLNVCLLKEPVIKKDWDEINEIAKEMQRLYRLKKQFENVKHNKQKLFRR
jgi:hypothetical protein